MLFRSGEYTVFDSVKEFFKFILIGLGTGLTAGIIVFKALRTKFFDNAHELGLVGAAIGLYILTEQLIGSGIIAVLVFGIFYGNSFVKKRNNTQNFSPFIFKNLEILVFMILGLIIGFKFDTMSIIKGLIVYVVYLVLRFIVLSIFYKSHSLQNRLLLTLAPMGIV